jgi:hypothetical protein
MTEIKRKPPLHQVDDSQSPVNEAQQQAAGSGDPRTNNSVDNLPLPFGGPSDNLHPITQPRGDVSKGDAEVGAPSRPNRRPENAMRMENTEREYQGDNGPSEDEELPGRMQDRTSVRPKDERETDETDDEAA